MTDLTFNIPSRDDMLRAVVPPKQRPPMLRPRWARVNSLAPLRVQMIGDDSQIDATPETLVADLVPEDIVWTTLSDKGALVVVGRLGGTPAVPAVPPVSLDPIELGAGVDLNTVITAGTYTQSNNNETSTALNYPAPTAGVLEVFVNSTGPAPNSQVYQRWTSYRHTGQIGLEAIGPTQYIRDWYQATWSPWYVASSSDVVGGTVAASTWYKKFANGDLWCRGRDVIDLVGGTGYIYPWTYPVPFVGELPQVGIMPVTTVPQNISVSINTETLTSVDLRFFRTTSSNTTFSYEARGQWK